MPFDEDDLDSESQNANKTSLKKVSSQKSIFDSLPKKPTQEQLEKRVAALEGKTLERRTKAAVLAKKFNDMVLDKTLSINKDPLKRELEKDTLSQMGELAQEINTDPDEKEGVGSLAWIVLLLRICLYQRNRINELEYEVSQISSKLEPAALKNLISKEIKQALDKIKNNE